MTFSSLLSHQYFVFTKVFVPAFKRLRWFYGFSWVVEKYGPPVPRLLAFGAATLIPTVLIALALRALPKRTIRGDSD